MTYETTHSVAYRPHQDDAIASEILPLLAGLLVTTALAASGTGILSAMGVGLFAYSLVWYIDSLGKELAILPAIATIASGQWLLGAYFAYYHDAVTYKYRMYVDETSYFSFVLPGTLAFIFAMKFLAPRISLGQVRKYIESVPPIDKSVIYYVIIFSIMTTVLGGSIRGPLAFFVYLISQFGFIAVIYMIMLKMQYRWIALIVTFGILASSSINQSLFHTLLLWSALLASFICAELRLGFLRKALLLALGILLIVQLQAAKSDYRDRIRKNPEQSGVVALYETMTENSIFEESEGYSAVNETGKLNARLNQGWIISSVMAYVPAAHPFEEGQTILRAIQDSFVPRILIEKREVSVSDGFRDYTGLYVNRETSFGISVLGEAWVNFGYYGIIMMAAVGAFFGLILRGIMKASTRYPTVILWTPLLFLQAAKAETELVVVLNHLAKTGMLIVVMYIFAYKFLKWRI
ncbi:MAG: hypothetical protein P1U65_16585 [Minwuia sp.]|nr:hypothetical protein [Minwuia sp.]